MYDNADLIRLMMISPTTYPLRDGFCIVVGIWRHPPLSILQVGFWVVVVIRICKNSTMNLVNSLYCKMNFG
jgi:hypothetical protein